MSTKRPGVEAGLNLLELSESEAWDSVSKHCKGLSDDIPNLKTYETALASFSDSGAVKAFFTKDELIQIVHWKHTVGKNRAFNMKHIQANSDEQVKKQSTTAVALARDINLGDLWDNGSSNEISKQGLKDIQDALQPLVSLKGVGPATASAVLALVRPDVFCYLYDEVIDCFEPKRDYTMPIYLRVNAKCLCTAKTLDNSAWTTARVAQTIWAAARFLALHGKDPTHELKLNAGKKRPASQKNAGEEAKEAKEPASKGKRRRT